MTDRIIRNFYDMSDLVIVSDIFAVVESNRKANKPTSRGFFVRTPNVVFVIPSKFGPVVGDKTAAHILGEGADLYLEQTSDARFLALDADGKTLWRVRAPPPDDAISDDDDDDFFQWLTSRYRESEFRSAYSTE